MDIGALPLTARFRLTQALRETVKDDKVLSAEEMVATAVPLLDEFQVPASEAVALVTSILASFKDGSKMDEEAQVLLAASSAGFELGTTSMSADDQALDAMLSLQQAGWNFQGMGPQQVLDLLKKNEGSDNPAAVDVDAFFYEGVRVHEGVYTNGGYQTIKRPELNHLSVKVTSRAELDALLRRGLKQRPPGNDYE